jgi:hypothetical protein
MSNSIMAIKRTAAACTLFGVALALLPLVAHAEGDQPRGSSSVVRLVVFQSWLSPLEIVRLPLFICPPSHPWLQNVDLAPGHVVPRGVEIVAAPNPLFVSVTIGGEHTDGQGRVTGWDHGHATNWDARLGQTLQIAAHCTSDPSQAYVRSGDVGSITLR